MTSAICPNTLKSISNDLFISHLFCSSQPSAKWGPILSHLAPGTQEGFSEWLLNRMVPKRGAGVGHFCFLGVFGDRSIFQEYRSVTQSAVVPGGSRPRCSLGCFEVVRAVSTHSHVGTSYTGQPRYTSPPPASRMHSPLEYRCW